MNTVCAGYMKEEVTIIIDGRKVTCDSNAFVLEAAKGAGIEIPTLCYLKGLTPTGACGVCAVEVIEDGERVIRHACHYTVKDGMEVFTNTPAVLEYRKKRIEKILENHPNDCMTCKKTGRHCGLQDIAFLTESVPKLEAPKRGIDDSAIAMVRDMDKCIACGRCVTVCEEVQKIGVLEMYTDPVTGDRYARPKEGKSLAETKCINCGQCVKVCPTAALTERDEVDKVMKAIGDPDTTVVWQMAPSVSHTLGEEFGFAAGTDVTGKIAGAMKQLGDYAFTTEFSADVTIMEEGNEFIRRISNGETLPMITSCCPGWIKFMEFNYPDLMDHVSTTKSPQQIFGALVKQYLPEKIGVDAKKIFHVSVMPCVAKKYESNRSEMETEPSLRDVDAVLTTREAAKLFRLRGINLQNTKEAAFDEFMGNASGSARTFGTTGGVMEAALRTVTAVLTDEDLKQIEYHAVNGCNGVKEATIQIGDKKVNIAVVNGIGNVRPVLDDIRSGKSKYHFIEVMACPGGCLNGGGAPLLDVEQMKKRVEKMNESSHKRTCRCSHENPEVQALYKEYLGEPCGHISHHILHTTYTDKSGE